MIFHIIVGRKEEATRTTSRVAYGLANLRIDTVDHSRDERTRREVLSSAALLVLAVALQYALIDGTLHVAIHNEPLLLIYHRYDFLQIHGLVYLVLRLGVDGTDKIALGAKNLQRFLVLRDKVQTIQTGKVVPLVAVRNSRVLTKHFHILCIHLQEKQIGKLGDIVSKANSYSGKSSGKSPYFLGERLLGRCIICHT